MKNKSKIIDNSLENYKSLGFFLINLNHKPF